jgi:predicted aconitase
MKGITKTDLEELILLPFKAMDERPSIVPIKSAHVSGVSYLNIGDAGADLLSEFSSSGLRVSVPTTMNPGFVEITRDAERTCDADTFEKQRRIIESLKKLGVTPSLTCTPYFQDNVPKPGDHLAWAESSAVLYANSLIGAWSNKESGIGALASAIMGYTANVGVHRPEGRKPELNVLYKGTIANEVEAGALGYLIGKKAGDSIHAIEAPGLIEETDRIIEYLAAFGTSGSTPMVYIKGIGAGQLLAHETGLGRLSISDQEVKSTIEELSSDGEPEAIVIGCPHVSLSTLRFILENSEKLGSPSFIFASANVRNHALKVGFQKKSNRVKIVADSCVMWCGLRDKGIDMVMTNSVKAAYYLSNQLKINVKLKPLNNILKEGGR